ncbi:glycosyltransferase family 2 protein [Bacillus sp. FJAT-27231]|uniref:glycosyltransferase family 2 protein n=1 Tax=Bacillus sp. FJAT-27231 TaxID=1679168 RepID=UPI0006717F66|nr:glycosyltransferase [Bacillus sp. FJAT-27231]
MLIWLFLVFFFSTLFPLFHLFNAIDWKNKGRKKLEALFAHEEQGFSILIPCYNEDMILRTTMDGLHQLNYANYEVIFINDGSTDHTLDTLHTLLNLQAISYHPGKLSHKPIKHVYQSRTFQNFYVIDKVNGGKADSLNSAIPLASKENIITLDADSVLEKQSLSIVNNYMQDPNIIAAGGMVHALQAKRSKEPLTLSFKNLKSVVQFQIFEYLKGFYVYKKSLAKLDALAIISGAFGIFKRNILLELNGYKETLGEDIDITLRFQQYIHRSPHKKIVFIPEAICYTECPETWGDLFKQRIRWQKAFIDCVIKHFPFFLKTFLTRTLGFFFLIDAFLIGVIGSYFTLTSFVFLSLEHDTEFALQSAAVYIIGSFICNIIYNSIAVYLSYKEGVRLKGKDILIFLKVLCLDLLVYRFVTLFFVMFGTFLYLFNRKSWNKVARTGRVYKFEKQKVGA